MPQNEKENRTGRLVLIRTYQPPYWSYSNHDFCAMAQPWAPSLDLCDWNSEQRQGAVEGMQRQQLEGVVALVSVG